MDKNLDNPMMARVHDCLNMYVSYFNDDRISTDEKKKTFFYMDFARDDPNIYWERNGNEFQFICVRKGTKTMIMDMERYVFISLALKSINQNDDIDRKMKIFFCMEKVVALDLLCPYREIVETLSNYGVSLLDGRQVCRLNMLERCDQFELMRTNDRIIVDKNMRKVYGKLDTSPFAFNDILCIYVKDNVLYKYRFPCINIYKDFVIDTKYKKKQTCEICYETKFKRMYECGNCKKKRCVDCFEKCAKMICPYCRYHLHDHIHKNIDKHGLRDLVVEIPELDLPEFL